MSTYSKISFSNTGSGSVTIAWSYASTEELQLKVLRDSGGSWTGTVAGAVTAGWATLSDGTLTVDADTLFGASSVAFTAIVWRETDVSSATLTLLARAVEELREEDKQAVRVLYASGGLSAITETASERAGYAVGFGSDGDVLLKSVSTTATTTDSTGEDVTTLLTALRSAQDSFTAMRSELATAKSALESAKATVATATQASALLSALSDASNTTAAAKEALVAASEKSGSVTVTIESGADDVDTLVKALREAQTALAEAKSDMTTARDALNAAAKLSSAGTSTGDDTETLLAALREAQTALTGATEVLADASSAGSGSAAVSEDVSEGIVAALSATESLIEKTAAETATMRESFVAALRASEMTTEKSVKELLKVRRAEIAVSEAMEKLGFCWTKWKGPQWFYRLPVWEKHKDDPHWRKWFNSLAGCDRCHADLRRHWAGETAVALLYCGSIVEGVMDHLDAIHTVADNISDVNTVADNISDVNTVADNIGNVNTVATNIEVITTVATNIEAIIEAVDAAERAAASATEAANSATASAESATASAESATASAESATESANSATASANSATESAQSATEAKASATESANSATESANSATEANASATESANSATESANSATESANSATESKTSASESAASASEAATSATAAATSAEAAALSEQNVSTMYTELVELYAKLSAYNYVVLTREEYDALEEKDDDVIYFVKGTFDIGEAVYTLVNETIPALQETTNDTLTSAVSALQTSVSTLEESVSTLEGELEAEVSARETANATTLTAVSTLVDTLTDTFDSYLKLPDGNTVSLSDSFRFHMSDTSVPAFILGSVWNSSASATREDRWVSKYYYSGVQFISTYGSDAIVYSFIPANANQIIRRAELTDGEDVSNCYTGESLSYSSGGGDDNAYFYGVLTTLANLLGVEETEDEIALLTVTAYRRESGTSTDMSNPHVLHIYRWDSEAAAWNKYAASTNSSTPTDVSAGEAMTAWTFDYEGEGIPANETILIVFAQEDEADEEQTSCNIGIKSDSTKTGALVSEPDWTVQEQTTSEFVPALDATYCYVSSYQTISSLRAKVTSLETNVASLETRLAALEAAASAE